MKDETKQVGRPVIKPKRKMVGFAINCAFIDKMQVAQVKLKGSLNDLYNEAVEDFLKKHKI